MYKIISDIYIIINIILSYILLM